MSVQAMTRVMDFSEATGINRLVLLVMANRAGGDFDECFASVDRLAFECRIDVRTVQRAVKRLVKANDLAVAGIHPKHRTNVYRVMPAATVRMFTPAGVAESHPPGATTPPAPPELKELGVTGSATASTSSHPNSARFDEFWDVYPIHRDRKAARVAWDKAIKRADPDTIIAGAMRYRDDPNRDPAKTKYAQGWLNGDRWQDDPLPSPRNQAPRDRALDIFRNAVEEASRESLPG
jgi:Helix-turn-helix domain